MRNFLISFVGIIAALSLFSVGAHAATNEMSSDTDELPAACGPSVASSTSTTTATTTATPTATVAATTATGDDEDGDGHAIRACIAALHEGDEHQAEHHGNDNDDASPVVAVAATSTPTPTTTTTKVATSVSTGHAKHGNNSAQHRDSHGEDHGHDD